MLTQFRVIWQLMRGFRLRYGLALACLVAATSINYLVPLVGSVTIDYAITGKTVDGATPLPVGWLLQLLGGAENLRAHLWLAPLAMLAFAVLSGVFSYFKGWQASLASDGIARKLKNDLYDHLNHLPARYHDRAQTGDLVQRCTSDVETTRQFLASQVMEIGNSVILLLTALPLMLSLNAPMTFVSFVLFPPIIIYSYVYFRQVKHVFKAVDEAEGALTSVIQENLTGIRVVRAFARQDYEQKKFDAPNDLYRDRSLRMLRLMSWYWSISDIVAFSQIGLTLFVGAWWLTTGAISVGTLFVFLAYLGMIMWPVRQLGRILTELGKTSVALTRIKEILSVERESEVAPATGETFHGALNVCDVHFHHGDEAPTEGRGALNGVSFEVRPGETLAIIGPSGSGKSTLMHLLMRLYDYKRGSIQFDGRELTSLSRGWVRSQIGVVMQEPFLFSKTLRDNLRLGRGDAPDQEIHEAARVAHIHDTILTFPEGYNTLIGERGITLSGGQRQRMAIARAVLKRPPLLILDDALSAVDGETEKIILDALRQRRGQATTLVIAHRLSTLAHADRVIVLDHGRIIQTGTHAELAAADGLYRRLWQIQSDVASDLQRELQSK